MSQHPLTSKAGNLALLLAFRGVSVWSYSLTVPYVQLGPLLTAALRTTQAWAPLSAHLVNFTVFTIKNKNVEKLSPRGHDLHWYQNNNFIHSHIITPSFVIIQSVGLWPGARAGSVCTGKLLG